MDWRADPGKPAKLRYVHHFSPSELHVLGESQGLILQDEFLSDGKEGNLGLFLQDEFFSDGKEGNLGLYQVWRKPGL